MATTVVDRPVLVAQAISGHQCNIIWSIFRELTKARLDRLDGSDSERIHVVSPTSSYVVRELSVNSLNQNMDELTQFSKAAHLLKLP